MGMTLMHKLTIIITIMIALTILVGDGYSIEYVNNKGFLTMVMHSSKILKKLD